MCQGSAFILQNEPINGDMWIQALTYFRDQAEPHDIRNNELLIAALKDIREKNILSPLLVLEILKRNPNLRFGVLKSFMLEHLKTQQKRIDKHNARLNEEMTKIRNCKSEIAKMKQTAIDFNNKKTCDQCKRELSLPTVHFMCKHTYCESCVDDVNGIRKCPQCNDRKYLIERASADDKALFAVRQQILVRDQSYICAEQARHGEFLPRVAGRRARRLQQDQVRRHRGLLQLGPLLRHQRPR